MQSYSETDKTLFTFDGEDGKSTLTLDKSVADALQTQIPDIHAWIQKLYDGINVREERYTKYINSFSKQGGKLTRLEIGNIIRFIAIEIAIEDSEF